MNNEIHLQGMDDRLVAKYELISKKSCNCIVVCGPSGVGKTMAIDHMIKTYGYISIPFITTRDLRENELNTGSQSVGYRGFMSMKLRNMLFLCAQNYGNSYGYSLETITDQLLNGKIIIIETPASQLLTDIRILLPNALIFGFVTYDHTISAKILNDRDSYEEVMTKLRNLQCSIESFNIQLAREKMPIKQIIPEYGKPESTIKQIDEVINDHLSFIT